MSPILAAMMSRQKAKARQYNAQYPNRTPIRVEPEGFYPPPVFAEPLMKPKDLQEGLRDLIDKPFLNGERYRDQQLRAEAAGAHPHIVEFRAAFRRRLERVGIPMFAHEIWRDLDRQNDLFKAGHSKAKAGESPHNWGCAIDLVHSVHGWGLTEEHWKLIGHMGKELARQRGFRLEWGGDWKFYDPAHWEVKGWREVAQVMATRPEFARDVPGALQFIAQASEKRAVETA